MKEYALIGYPIGHSMSEIIHKELFKIVGVKGKYSLIEVKPEVLECKFNRKLKKLDGFNVTIPHKVNIIQFLDELSTKAKLFGAVNTVVKKDGKLIGYNTDCVGFIRALKDANISISGKVLICGTGGVSRMFAYESILAGADVTIAVRESSLEKANILREEIYQKLSKDCKIILLSEAKGGYDLIINGTPVGMYPNVNECPLKEEVIKSSKAVFDSIYNPIDTMLIKYAKEAGIKYSNGLSMLVWQAAFAEEIWNNIKFSKKDIDNVIKKTKRQMELTI